MRPTNLILILITVFSNQLFSQSITSSNSKSPHFENLSVVFTATGTPSGGSWSINGGNDASLFQVNSTSGEISFKSSPDYENPADNGKNNIYDFQIAYAQGGNTV